MKEPQQTMKKVVMGMSLALLTAATPSDAKDKRTFYDEATMDRARDRIAKYEWARAQVQSAKAAAAWYLTMTDQELWDFVPPPEQMRAINVCIAHDCPVCGDEITRKAGHYPWRMARDRPFKLTCPVCNNEFPSNDFQPWNTEGLAGKPEETPGYVDKGLGWLDTRDGRRYWFVSYYIFWQRWARDVLGGLRDLGQAYLLTDDPIYAHKCAVMMVKLASEYERFDYATQCYHEGVFGIGGRISDYIWSCGNNTTIALAYDAIWPAFDQNPGLLAFLREKGIDEPRTVIETKMLDVMVGDILDGRVSGNMGMHQQTGCYLALVLANDDPARGHTTQDMRDWLMKGSGRIEDLLWNGFFRDGLGGESAPGYSSGWCTRFYAVARLLPRLGIDIWSNPRLKKMADIGLDLTIAGKWAPDIGDSGGLKGSGPVGWSPALLGPAFMRYKDPRHAKALKAMGARAQDLFEEYFDEEEVARVCAADPTELTWKTRNIGGYGLAVLESGRGDLRRAVTLYYGFAGGGHGHRDRLNIQMWSNSLPILPEDGYPVPFRRPDFHAWRSSSTVRHYSVVVDEKGQQNLKAGYLNTLAATPEVQLADASAEFVYPGVASLYRRTSALIDISQEKSYLLDIFRVRGGRQHDWCFHGPPFPEFAIAGGKLGAVQEKGTLAGEDVPYGAKPPSTGESGGTLSGFHGLYNVRRMTPAGAWSASWRRPEDGLTLTMTMPEGCAGEVITADASPELQPGNPDEIQYVLGRNRSTDQPASPDAGLFSTYIAVVEPHVGTAAVTAVERLRATNTSPDAIGVAVCRGAVTDLVHSALDPAEKCEWHGAGQTFIAAAEFALLTLDATGVRRALVINGTLLQYGEFALAPAASPQGKVLALDFASNSLLVEANGVVPETCRDAVVILGNSLHQTSYTIEGARRTDGGVVLDLGDVLYVVGMGAVSAIDETANTVTADRDLSGYGRGDGAHVGRWLYNEDKSSGFRIAAVHGKVFTLDGVTGGLGETFRDEDGDGRRLYWISDIGPGDTFRIPAVTFYKQD